MTENNEILNAKIVDTKLGVDHGWMTAYLYLEGGGWVCNYGGYCLDHWFGNANEHASIGGFGSIIELMKVVGVESWEDLKGRFIRVKSHGWGSDIISIGNILRDEWFSFDEYFKGYKNENE